MKDEYASKFGSGQGQPGSSALDSAFRILARRDHTRQELAQKLRQKGFERRAVDAALERCRALGYLDDAKTALVVAGQLTQRGYGPLRVRQVLRQKGLDDTLIENALPCCGDEVAQEHSARRMLGKKAARLGRETDPWKRRQIAYRFLSGRGFPSAIVNRVITDV